MYLDDSRPSFGLRCQHENAERMTAAHRHDDIEFNLPARPLRYLLDGGWATLPASRISCFWAARPHQLVTDGEPTDFYWMTVPLTTALAWRLPPGFVSRLMSGLVMTPELGEARSFTVGRLQQWSGELGGVDDASIARLEIEAFVRRVAAAPDAAAPATTERAATEHAATEGAATEPAGADSRVTAARMASFISANSAEPLQVKDVADHVHLHPNYAMTLFKRVFGTSIGAYLAQCRIASAQRLLITTPASIPDIAAESGFATLSTFYERFRAECGVTPAAYRHATQ